VADDSNMKPQLEEDIEDIRWMNLQEVNLALENSYYAIIEVFGHYFKSHTRLTSQKQQK
jgi:8-oxo-(d)GTP phosphatase